MVGKAPLRRAHHHVAQLVGTLRFAHPTNGLKISCVGVMRVNPRELAMADEARSRLGRGLASLIGDVGGEAAHLERPRGQRKLPIEFLRPNPRNPRRIFTDADLDELAASIRERGIIQPIIWRAAQRASLHEVPVVVVDATDEEALEFAIVENVQRTDLNAIEEAEGYRRLSEEFNRSQDDIAQIVGKSRSHVANTMRLLKLSDNVKAFIHSGKLSAGH